MYFTKAIERINNIDWDKVGIIGSEEDVDLGREFLRRAAQFYKEQSLKPMHPMFTHIAKLLGDTEQGIDVSKHCNSKALKMLAENTSAKRIVEFYIQLAKYVELNLEYTKYLSVYEPLIRIFERGGSLVFRMNELEIKNVIYLSMTNWYERYGEIQSTN